MVKARRSKARGASQKVWKRIHLREWRLFRGLTVEALAAASGVSSAQISLIENKQSAGSPDSLEKLAKALGCAVGELIDVKPEVGGAMLRLWVPEAELARIQAVVAAMKR